MLVLAVGCGSSPKTAGGGSGTAATTAVGASAEAQQCASDIATMVVPAMAEVTPQYAEQILGNLGADTTSQSLVATGITLYQSHYSGMPSSPDQEAFAHGVIETNVAPACQTDIDNGSLNLSNLESAYSSYQQMASTPAPSCSGLDCPGSDG